jgi:hypothetical protein
LPTTRRMIARVMNGIADEQELDDLAAGDPMVP